MCLREQMRHRMSNMGHVIGTFATGVMNKVEDFLHAGNTETYKRPSSQPTGLNAHPAKPTAQKASPLQTGNMRYTKETPPSSMPQGTTFGQSMGQ